MPTFVSDEAAAKANKRVYRNVRTQNNIFSFIKLHHSLSSCIYAWFYTDRTGAKDESRTKTADRSGTWSPGSSSTKSRTESKWARVSLPRAWRPRTSRSSSHMRARRKCEQADRPTKRRAYTEDAKRTRGEPEVISRCCAADSEICAATCDISHRFDLLREACCLLA